jgi:Uma2 family endonuclease
MVELLEPLVQSPRLPQYVAELNRLLAAEQAARERFRNTLSPEQKAEFIAGQVIMHSPARFRHTQIRELLARLLGAYVDFNNLGWVGSEKVLVALTRNDFEPDIVFYGREKAAALRPDQTLFPPPDLVVEILSDTTEARDRGVKMEDYAAHGVAEYWLVDPDREVVELYDLEGERYTLRAKQADGTLRSRVISGFAVPVRAVFDRALNLETLQRIAVARPGSEPPRSADV